MAASMTISMNIVLCFYVYVPMFHDYINWRNLLFSMVISLYHVFWWLNPIDASIPTFEYTSDEIPIVFCSSNPNVHCKFHVFHGEILFNSPLFLVESQLLLLKS